MKQTIRHIEYLLQRHDCVIVPGLGAVLAHGTPAYYDESRCIWMPPRRIFSFNPELSRTDGLLASSIARRENIGMETATAKLRTAVDQMKNCYETEGKLNLGEVGELAKGAEGTMTFVPSQSAWLSPDFLWLPMFDVQTFAGASELAHEYADNERRRNTLSVVLRRAGQIAACLAVIFAFGWVVKSTLPDTPTEQFASVAPVAKTSSLVDIPGESQPTLVLVLKNQEEEDAENKTTDAVVTVEESNSGSDGVRLNSSDEYFLIVASLGSLDEAQKYLRQHSDIKLGILTIDGRFRVYAASGTSYSEALAAAKDASIAERYADTWVCRR